MTETEKAALAETWGAKRDELLEKARNAWQVIKEVIKEAVRRAFKWVHRNLPIFYNAEIDRLDRLLRITKKTNARRKLLRRRGQVKGLLRNYERGYAYAEKG